MRRFLLTIMALSAIITVQAQERKLTMEEAIVGYHLMPQNRYYAWQGDRSSYTYIFENQLVAEDIKGGDKTVLLTLDELNTILKSDLKGFPQFRWMDEHTLLINRQGKEFRIDIDSKSIKHIVTFPAKIENITYSKAGDRYAYTKGNNLFILTANGDRVQVTSDRDKNIVNGQIVSRNEFGIEGGIFWSPDGKKIAFYRKDESKVTAFPLLDITTRTGELKEIKYPMAGMSSEVIQLGVYDIDTKETIFLNVDDFDQDRYLTNITWSPLSDVIYLQVLNRGQDHMRLNKYDATTGAFIATLFEEQSNSYVEPQESLTFVDKRGERFIFVTNNRDGYFSLYLHDAKGKMIRRLTPVKADVALVGVDNEGKYAYYTSAEVSPVENHLFRVEIKSGKRTRLTFAEGWHDIIISGTKDCFIDNYSSLRVPRVIEVVSNNGKQLRRLLEAEDPTVDYDFGEITLGSIKAENGNDLYYRLIKPSDFNPAKRYPVILYVYGGPHSQMVQNRWNASLRMWEMYMAQNGYVVFVMDNQGTSNRGKAFEDIIFRNCGQQEMQDQMRGIEFLKSHSWVDGERIGVHGWSYGGFMTISLMTNYPETFKVGVAGGPVIDWKWYEIMYGERYMDSPEENPEGYAKTSLINRAKNLKGKLLICQGMVDPVVLTQHSLNFVQECIKNNIQLDYFPYPCDEHNVRGRDRIHLMQKVTDYFEDYLK